MSDAKPIPCETWKERLATTCPDDLPAIEKEAFTMHVATCPACAAVFADDYETDELIRSVLLAERSPEVWKGFLSTISQLNSVKGLLSDELLNEKFLGPSSRFDEQNGI
jgi:hypothetical protein